MLSNQVEIQGKFPRSVLSDREAESAVLMKAAAMLKHVQTHWSAPNRERALEQALQFNQRLWTFFQASVTEESNPLPGYLKENIVRLSAFVDRKTFEIMAYPSSDKLEILIGLNVNIAAGLKSPGS